MTVKEKVIASMLRFSLYVTTLQPDNMLAISHTGEKIRADIMASDEDLATYADALVQASPHVAEVLMVKISEELQKFELKREK